MRFRKAKNPTPILLKRSVAMGDMQVNEEHIEAMKNAGYYVVYRGGFIRWITGRSCGYQGYCFDALPLGGSERYSIEAWRNCYLHYWLLMGRHKRLKSL